MGLATLIFWKAMVRGLAPDGNTQREDRKWRVQREATEMEAQKNGCKWRVAVGGRNRP